MSLTDKSKVSHI